jgi:hypothetical protein
MALFVSVTIQTMSIFNVDGETIVHLATLMTSCKLGYDEQYNKYLWDDIAGALANVRKGRPLYLQKGTIIQPYQVPGDNDVYGGCTYQIKREDDTHKHWFVYTRDGVLVQELKSSKSAWSWVKRVVIDEGCVKVLNKKVYCRGLKPVQYACQYLEEAARHDWNALTMPAIVEPLRDVAYAARDHA